MDDGWWCWCWCCARNVCVCLTDIIQRESECENETKKFTICFVCYKSFTRLVTLCANHYVWLQCALVCVWLHWRARMRRAAIQHPTTGYYDLCVCVKGQGGSPNGPGRQQNNNTGSCCLLSHLWWENVWSFTAMTLPVCVYVCVWQGCSHPAAVSLFFCVPVCTRVWQRGGLILASLVLTNP